MWPVINDPSVQRRRKCDHQGKHADQADNRKSWLQQ